MMKKLMMLLAATLLLNAGAAESIAITATPRYPWNGKVDLEFTIDGTSGTKYDTSFTAKDVVGGTNLTMKTLYKSNGTAANVAREQLLPGTYNWVWDATADLGEGVVVARAVVEGKTVSPLDVNTATYMVIDMSGGTSATSYPVSYLAAVPSEGWSDTYKTTKLVLRKVKKGSNTAGGSMSQDMWVGIFEVMQKQWILAGMTYPSCYSYGNWSPTKNDKFPIESITSSSGKSFVSAIKSKCGVLSGARIPTSSEWQFACRGGVTTALNNGTSLTVENANVVAWWGLTTSGSTAYNKYGHGMGKPCVVGQGFQMMRRARRSRDARIIWTLVGLTRSAGMRRFMV